jgi:DNA-binding NarL/FixJ family response regulator
MKVDEKDVKAMVRLAAKAVVRTDDPAQRKRHLLEELCKLVDANAWVWGLTHLRIPKSRVFVALIHGGMPQESLAKYLQTLDHPDTHALFSNFYLEASRTKRHITRLKAQVVNEKRFAASPVHALWKEADLGDAIFSRYPLDEKTGSTLGIYRSYNREKFTTRDRQIVDIVMSEIAWLHHEGWRSDQARTISDLSKRERQTLNLLALGRSRKEIASDMNISVHTVQGYTKHLYRHFQVNSQTELMNRFFQGKGVAKRTCI